MNSPQPSMSASMMFYRIENAAGHGPYHSNCLFRAGFSVNTYTGDRHPAPHQDSALWEGLEIEQGGYPDVKPYIFGFSSLEQLRAWFFADKVLKYLRENGFRLYSSNVQRIAGNSQAICLKEIWAAAEKKEVDILALLS